MASNNGKPPAGHKGANDKAYLEWKAKHDAAKKTSRVAMLDGSNTEDEDDWEETDSDECAPVFSLVTEGTPWDEAARRPQHPVEHAHPNAFQATQDDDDRDVDVNVLNDVAHRIQLGKKLP